jgi:hypothetical protein
MKKMFFLFIFIVAGSMVTIAQNATQIIITIITDNTLKTTTDANKNIEFSISGLDTQEKVSGFTEKIKTYRGVLGFEISDADSGNTRTCNCEFYKYANKSYFAGLMQYCGVDLISINGATYTISEFKNQKLVAK